MSHGVADKTTLCYLNEHKHGTGIREYKLIFYVACFSHVQKQCQGLDATSPKKCVRTFRVLRRKASGHRRFLAWGRG